MHPGCLILTNSHLTISTCARGNSSRRADRPCWTKCSSSISIMLFFCPSDWTWCTTLGRPFCHKRYVTGENAKQRTKKIAIQFQFLCIDNVRRLFRATHHKWPAFLILYPSGANTGVPVLCLHREHTVTRHRIEITMQPYNTWAIMPSRQGWGGGLNSGCLHCTFKSKHV